MHAKKKKSPRPLVVEDESPQLQRYCSAILGLIDRAERIEVDADQQPDKLVRLVAFYEAGVLRSAARDLTEVFTRVPLPIELDKPTA